MAWRGPLCLAPPGLTTWHTVPGAQGCGSMFKPRSQMTRLGSFLCHSGANVPFPCPWDVAKPSAHHRGSNNIVLEGTLQTAHPPPRRPRSVLTSGQCDEVFDRGSLNTACSIEHSCGSWLHCPCRNPDHSKPSNADVRHSLRTISCPVGA